MSKPPTKKHIAAQIVIEVPTSDDPGPHRVHKSEALLGTSPACDVTLGEGADPVHCIISRTRHGYFVEDIESSMGTRLDGKPMKQFFVEAGQPFQAGWDTVVLREE